MKRECSDLTSTVLLGTILILYPCSPTFCIPYSGKVWRGECLANLPSVWWKKVWRMNRSAKGLLMVTTGLDGFSLANRR